ncbi:PAS domain-containing hybrid sensor histidine kinase/response regulator [Confluentibacter citreus]|uniref:PAS domain-containing hybrid sensor histidine kinase/response regulator n=1 Tax=Confluentibacter citreus TaxID=2007307 RepID=UPI000C290249|nr:PAS domain-containing hybrid sensor histidine kinase/response regulator [Confluentibacter citreus]
MKRLFLFCNNDFDFLLESMPGYDGLIYCFFSDTKLLNAAIKKTKPDAILIDNSGSSGNIPDCISFNDSRYYVPVIVYGKPFEVDKYSHLEVLQLPSQFDAVTIFELFSKLNLIDKAYIGQKEKLEESQRFLDLLMSNIPDAIYFKDRDSRFTKINQAQANTLGIASPEEAIGKRDEDFFEENQSREAHNDEQSLMENGIPLIKKLEHLVTSSGEKYVRATKIPLKDSKGNSIGMVGISRDVTNEYLIERDLRREKRYMDLLMDNLPDRIYFKNRNSQFIRCNMALANMFGLSEPEALYGKTDFDFFEHAHAQEAFDDEQRIMSEKSYILNKLESHVKNGERFWELTTKIPFLNSKKEVIGIVGISHNFTEQKRLEDRLEKEKDFLQILMNNIPDYIFFKDINSKYIRANKAIANFFKIDIEDLIGKSDADFLSKDASNKHRKQDEIVLEKGLEIINEVEKLQDLDGNTIWLSVTKVPIRDKSSKIIGLAGISRDATMQELTKQRYAIAKEKAEEANKAKSLFLANMSHEIRTPMNGIIGMADILSKSSLEPIQMEYLDIIVKSGQTLLSLINDILDFSKIESGNMELETVPINIRSIIEEVADLHLVPAVAKSTNLFTFIDPNIPEFVSGDYIRLKQIITNLVNNAIKFTSDGEVAIYVNQIESKDGFHEIEFKVKDSGIGISKENQKKLFKSFSQVDASTTRKYGGTGLGLAISQRLVDQMGGALELDSSPDTGSTFFFKVVFPFSNEVKKQDIILNKQALKGKRVVVVDNNETNRFILKNYLKAWGMEVIELNDGALAYDFLKKASLDGNPVDLVLVDYQVLGVNGKAFVQNLKQNPETRNIKLILLSSITQAIDKDGFEVGLNKPIKMNQLLNALFKALEMQYEDRVIEWTESDNYQFAFKNKRFLIVEDNLINIKVARIVLSELSDHVEVAHNGIEAIELFENQNFDIILMDIRMPLLGGIEATLKIREMEKNNMVKFPVKIIAMTANTFQEDIERCLENGMDAFLEKPFKRKDLVTILQRVL